MDKFKTFNLRYVLFLDVILEDTFILVQLIAGIQNTVNTKRESG